MFGQSGPTAAVPSSVMSDLAGTYLERIVMAHRRRAAADGRDVGKIREAARSCAEPTRGFAVSLQVPGLSVIAEIKRRSPSKGSLAPDLDPAGLAGAYERGGAAGLSVLTDVDHFGGSIADLQAARAATALPIIRKDFTVSELDVYDARLMGADCVLLIAAALNDHELSRFHQCACDVGLDALVEIHDEAELERALAVGATLVGVNQRDLRTFSVDHDRARRVGRAMPSSVVRVAESGVRGPDDAASLAEAGFDAVLVGESLVTMADPAAGVAALRHARTSSEGSRN
jgi:indole-3-glycerol phosphate synthase